MMNQDRIAEIVDLASSHVPGNPFIIYDGPLRLIPGSSGHSHNITPGTVNHAC
jgi:hypothetical protein